LSWEVGWGEGARYDLCVLGSGPWEGPQLGHIQQVTLLILCFFGMYLTQPRPARPLRPVHTEKTRMVTCWMCLPSGGAPRGPLPKTPRSYWPPSGSPTRPAGPHPAQPRCHGGMDGQTFPFAPVWVECLLFQVIALHGAHALFYATPHIPGTPSIIPPSSEHRACTGLLLPFINRSGTLYSMWPP
jgi:hypothetical protein